MTKPILEWKVRNHICNNGLTETGPTTLNSLFTYSMRSMDRYQSTATPASTGGLDGFDEDGDDEGGFGGGGTDFFDEDGIGGGGTDFFDEDGSGGTGDRDPPSPDKDSPPMCRPEIGNYTDLAREGLGVEPLYNHKVQAPTETMDVGQPR